MPKNPVPHLRAFQNRPADCKIKFHNNAKISLLACSKEMRSLVCRINAKICLFTFAGGYEF